MRCLHCGKDGIALSTTNCPKCGVYLPNLMRDILPHSTRLNKHYHIDYALGRGGFGITYRAIHLKTEQQVAIKEYYPQEYAVREGGSKNNLKVLEKNREAYDRGLQRFIKEAKTLAKINHPNVVRLQGFFEENETAYIVMELIQGKTLREELDSQANKCFSSQKVKELMNALIAAISEIHRANIYHLDIKPENILIAPQARIVLVDFGSSKQGITSESTQAFTIAYAPLEVISGGKVGTYSDVFELGAIAYEMLTGQKPLDALKRLQEPNWRPNLLEQPWQNLIESALHLEFQKRPQNVKLWWESTFSLAPVKSLTVNSAKNSSNLQLESKSSLSKVTASQPEIYIPPKNNSQLKIVKPRYPTIPHGDIFAIDTLVTYLSNGRETKSRGEVLFNVNWCIFLSTDPRELLIAHYRQKFARENIYYQERSNEWFAREELHETRSYTVSLKILSVKDRGYHNSFSLPANTKSVIIAVLEKKQQERSRASKLAITPNLKLLKEPINPPVHRAYVFAIDTEVSHVASGQEFKMKNRDRFKITWCIYVSRDPQKLLIEHYQQKFSRSNRIQYQPEQNKWSKIGLNQNRLPYNLSFQITSVTERFGNFSYISLPDNAKNVITIVLEEQEQQNFKFRAIDWRLLFKSIFRSFARSAEDGKKKQPQQQQELCK